MATAKQLDDITECPICTEVYTDPRVLPCVHTYCLKCIEGWSKDKQAGDKLACPLCRKEFTLPSNGVTDLPKNVFVSNFLQMKELSSVQGVTSLCEACSGGKESESEVQNVASVYCVECQMKFCRNCERVHKAIKLTSSHTLLQIGEEIDVKKLYKSLSPTYCDQHETEDTKIYCFDCKSTICTMCYMETHKSHSCSDISKVDDDFRKQMARDAEKTISGVEKCREMIERLEKEKNDFGEQVAKTEIKIGKKAEQMKQLIDAHRDRLMAELASMKEKRMKEIESLREEIEIRLLSMESYKKYADEVREKGTACDVARAASDLHDRADELFTFDVIERALADLGYGYVTLSSSRDDICRAIGQLRVNSAKEGKLHPNFLLCCFSMCNPQVVRAYYG